MPEMYLTPLQNRILLYSRACVAISGICVLCNLLIQGCCSPPFVDRFFVAKPMLPEKQILLDQSGVRVEISANYWTGAANKTDVHCPSSFEQLLKIDNKQHKQIVIDPNLFFVTVEIANKEVARLANADTVAVVISPRNQTQTLRFFTTPGSDKLAGLPCDSLRLQIYFQPGAIKINGDNTGNAKVGFVKTKQSQ